MKDFRQKLKNIILANNKQKNTELWDVEGILHNQKFKFDTRPIQNNVKIGNFKTKADKMVFNMKNEYIVVDGEAVVRTDNILEILRLKRDALLTESDWTQVNDSPLTDTKKAEWATYRQELRDLPSSHQSTTNFDDVVFPTQPD